ncbi:MAG TPA: SRPBCC domain-containing protein [Pseudonocardiaceae bacterium]|jgi:uncharacterized protein YndB with AHSA1/START domain
MTDWITIEREYDATPETIWRLWTTAEGIASWWAPDGFTVTVDRIEPSPGGELIYTMTATGPEQIAFMKQAGMPLATESRKRFTELDPHGMLAYDSLVDFVPGADPYEFSTVIELAPLGERTRVTMTMEPLHDEVWTERLVAGRTNELDNLAKVV